MSDLWDNLLACLDLGEPGTATSEGTASAERAGGTEGTASTEEDSARSLLGTNLKLEYHRLFGGQLLAQFARAAALTCPSKTIKSLHALFPREGTADEPVRYEVRRQHEGRTFASLTILATQSRGVIGTASVSMHALEEGRALQTTDPVRSLPSDSAETSIGLLPFETRTSMDLDDPQVAPPYFTLWLRTPATDPALAPALAAYSTDLTLIGTALRAVPGLSQRDAQVAFTSAVTSHTLWFHRPFRTDNWLLLRQQSPVLAHGRSFGHGEILTADGTLVASYAQEAMVRFRGTD